MTGTISRTYRECYDTLVLCPSAEPIRPPIPGAGDERVDVLCDIADMGRIIARVEKGVIRAVVGGGSYIGLELIENVFETLCLGFGVASDTVGGGW